MWIWSFSGVCKLRDNFKPRCAMSESHWWYLFHKEVKSWDSTAWFRIWLSQTPAYKRYLQMHLLTERFVFGFYNGFFFQFAGSKRERKARVDRHLSSRDQGLQPRREGTCRLLSIYLFIYFCLIIARQSLPPPRQVLFPYYHKRIRLVSRTSR